MQGLSSLLSSIKYLPAAEVELVSLAYEIAENAHRGQKRVSGEPYIEHPIGVALILSELKADSESIVAALLHDVLEDTEFSEDQIRHFFGLVILQLVSGITKISSYQRQADISLTQAENFQKLIISASKDTRIIIVKLADRLHNLRTIGSLPQEKQKKIAKETLELYVPLARRLGVFEISNELQERCFYVLHPFRYSMIHSYLKKRELNDTIFLEEVQRKLTTRLKELNIKAEITYRQKSAHSIYSKLLEKTTNKKILLNDINAFKIITDNVDSCYRILGVVHNCYTPCKGMFKDYIAIPKETGYQSLHTSLLNQKGSIFEIQIKTTAMDAVANYGIASHWAYKNKWSLNTIIQAQFLFTKLLEATKHSDGTSFLDKAKTAITHNDIYVFSPKGEIFNLPKGASILDFAYAIHTNIGNTIVGAQLNGIDVPINQVLSTGDTIYIRTASSISVKKDWLGFVITNKAISAINDFLNKESLSPETQLVLIEKLKKLDFILNEDTIPQLNVKFAPCCLPIYGDSVVSYVGTHGIMIHLEKCHHTINLPKENIFPLKWGYFEMEFLTSLSIKVHAYYKDTLSSIANAFILKNIIVEQLTILDDNNYQTHTIKAKFYVKNRDELSNIIQIIRQWYPDSKIKRKIY